MDFENHMFRNNEHNILQKWAVPTIFPGMEGSSAASNMCYENVSLNKVCLIKFVLTKCYMLCCHCN
nr:unnamed protein product [Callosobruchus analis]